MTPKFRRVPQKGGWFTGRSRYVDGEGGSVSWFLGFLVLLVSWFVVSWIVGLLFLGLLVSGFLGFLVSQFQSSKVSKVQRSNINLWFLWKILIPLPNVHFMSS